jgi:hypothetical protein
MLFAPVAPSMAPDERVVVDQAVAVKPGAGLSPPETGVERCSPGPLGGYWPGCPAPALRGWR